MTLMSGLCLCTNVFVFCHVYCTVCLGKSGSGCGFTLRKGKPHPLGDWLCGHKSCWHTHNRQTQADFACQAKHSTDTDLMTPSSHEFLSHLSIQIFTSPLCKQETSMSWTSCGGLNIADVVLIKYLIYLLQQSALTLANILALILYQEHYISSLSLSLCLS